jgi:hypothetical protein
VNSLIKLKGMNPKWIGGNKLIKLVFGFFYEKIMKKDLEKTIPQLMNLIKK